MAENKNQTLETVPTPEVESKPNFLTRIRTEHPRKVKAAVITTAVLAAGVIGAVVGAKAGNDTTDDSETFEGEFVPATDTLTGSEA